MPALRPGGLEQRLRRVLLVALPAIWLVSLAGSLVLAKLEVDELFDTQQVRLARTLLASLPFDDPAEHPVPLPPVSSAGRAQLEDEMVAIWDRNGVLRMADQEGQVFLRTPLRTGFSSAEFGEEAWRLYTLFDADSGWQIVVGQRLGERWELMLDTSIVPLAPWLLALPLLLLINAAVVRTALDPVRRLTGELTRRSGLDLEPLNPQDVPAELAPLIQAGNALLGRVAQLRDRERRFIDCAAHELRTPIAALRLQWDAVRSKGSVTATELAAFGASIERISHLTSQLLDLARAEDRMAVSDAQPVDWPELVSRAASDCLAAAEAARVEIACTWPDDDPALAWPLSGDIDQLQTLLRNLLGNAIRHSPAGTEVEIRVGRDRLEVVDHGAGVDDSALSRLGERFYRAGTEPGGTGLGLAIVLQVARVHALAVEFQATLGGGLTVRLQPAASAPV